MRKPRGKAIRFAVPTVPERCQKCGRKLDGHVGGPFWPWAVPTTDGKTGITTCSLCDTETRYGIDVEKLPVTSQESIKRYRESESKKCQVCGGEAHGYGPEFKFNSPEEEAEYIAVCDSIGQVS